MLLHSTPIQYYNLEVKHKNLISFKSIVIDYTIEIYNNAIIYLKKSKKKAIL